jgi:GNAT superfamily N-acetyltransferase
MLRIRKIEDKSIDEYIYVLHERFEWLGKNGIAMWKLENLEKKSLIDRYEDPNFYGAFENNECVGGFILIEKDKRYWPEQLDDKAYYFHKFVIHPNHGGKGYSHDILEWVKNYGKENGKKYIRLDYEKKRDYLRNLYIQHGFKDIREIKIEDEKIVVLGEYCIL